GADAAAAALRAPEPCVQIRRVVALALDRSGPDDRQPLSDESVQPPLALGLSAVVGPDRRLPGIQGPVLGQPDGLEIPALVRRERGDVEVWAGLTAKPGRRRGRERGVGWPDVDDDVPAAGPDRLPALVRGGRAAKPSELLDARKELRVRDPA